MIIILQIILILFVLLGCIPLIASLYQFTVVGIHGIKNHYSKVEPYTANVAIVVPAWNEGNVIGNTIEQLYNMDYPKQKLRIYVVDDASTDHTPDEVKSKHKKYPNNVFHLRREKGGEGKAHTLNYGIKQILSDDWAQALLIIDADVLFEKNTLRKMTRHLVDPKVGSVTAYIKEGSIPGNFINKSIAFEYITAQAASRRAQNVIGVMACLAGGAQLHTRENLLAIGGKIDTSSLAEDTFTTFKTQINGRKAIFDANAIVWAEEPDDVVGVWKQRLRWARGNVQLTRAFKHIWFRPQKKNRLGSKTFGFLWFSIIFMPFYMIFTSTGLIGLLFIDFEYSWFLFRQLWILNAVTYLFVTFFSFGIDPATAKKSWLQGILFPGIISLVFIVCSIIPGGFEELLLWIKKIDPSTNLYVKSLIFFMYMWSALCMLPAWLAYRIDKAGKSKKWAIAMLLTSGFGPLLCVITLQSFISEFKKDELKWEKTEKTGKVQVQNSK